MAPENADRVAADAHAWAGNQSGIDGVAHGGVRRARALGSHVTLGSEARHQILAGRDFSEDRALGHGFDDGLHIFGSRMQEKMDVNVDEPRHQGCCAQIDHGGTDGMGDRGTDFNNAIAAYQNLAGAREYALLHIEDVGGMEHDGVAGGSSGGNRGRLSPKRMYAGESQDEDERIGRGTRRSQHAPNTSTLAGLGSASQTDRQ